MAPTCTSTGYTLHTCTCGDSYQDSETAMVDHSYTATVVSPTDTADGTRVYTCTQCGHSYSEVIHRYTSTVTEPTCTEAGHTLYECPCGYSHTGDVTDALGHNYVKTTETDTYAIYTCTRCGVAKKESTVVLPPEEPTVPDVEVMSLEQPSGEESVEVSLEAEAGEEAASGETAEVMAASSTDDRILESTIVQTYTYYYNGDLLRYMTVDGCSLYFVYDSNGKPLTVTYRDGTNSYFCYYVTNPQGDVTAILDSTGTAVVQYYYDAWGNILSTTGSMADTLGEYNPLRYRSYVYDTDAGLLQSQDCRQPCRYGRLSRLTLVLQCERFFDH